MCLHIRRATCWKKRPKTIKFSKLEFKYIRVNIFPICKCSGYLWRITGRSKQDQCWSRLRFSFEILVACSSFYEILATWTLSIRIGDYQHSLDNLIHTSNSLVPSWSWTKSLRFGLFLARGSRVAYRELPSMQNDEELLYEKLQLSSPSFSYSITA